MNKLQQARLETAVNNLMKAEEERNLATMAATHRVIRMAVASIYKSGVDVPTVLRVEQLLNYGQANVAGKSLAAYKQIEKLTYQGKVGIEMHEKFTKNPKLYAEYADDTRKGVAKGKPFCDGVPYDSVRSALSEFRDQLIEELVPRSGDPFLDRERTNRLRLQATIDSERNYMEKFVENRKHVSREIKEQDKEKCISRFDMRTNRQLSRTATQVEIPPQTRS